MYTPTSNTASHDYHEKSNEYSDPLGGSSDDPGMTRRNQNPILSNLIL